jgi:serine/threonine protein kinase
VIGNGAFGIVYKGFELKSNKKVALKKVLQDGHSKNRELSILKELNHVNIIELLDYYT